MAEQFDHVLNECIDLLLRGESLEQCLQRYPEHAARLEPLLRVAQAAHETSSTVEPRPDFKAQSRYQMRTLLHDRKQKSPSRRMPVLGWLPRWATAVIIGVFVLLAAGGGTAVAASNSLPGDILYPVKLATERVQFTFTFSDEGTANLHAKFAERRAEEMARIAEAGRSEKLQELKTRLEEGLEKLEKLTARIKQDKPDDIAWLPRLKQRLQRDAAAYAVKLTIAERVAPGPAKPFIADAKSRLGEAYREAILALNNTVDQ